MDALWEVPEDVRQDVERIKAAGLGFPDLDTSAPVTLVYGSAGSGKTRWAANIVMSGPGWYYCNAMDLIEHMRSCKNNADIVKLEHVLHTARRLVIDDVANEAGEVIDTFGTKRKPREIIRVAMMKRFRENMRTIYPTNIKPSSIVAIYDKSDKDRGRISSRLANHALLYFFRGDRRKGEQMTHKATRYIKDPKAKIETLKATIPLYEEPELDPRLKQPLREKDVRDALDAVQGKPLLAEIYYRFLRGTKFSDLAPSEMDQKGGE